MGEGPGLRVWFAVWLTRRRIVWSSIRHAQPTRRVASSSSPFNTRGVRSYLKIALERMLQSPRIESSSLRERSSLTSWRIESAFPFPPLVRRSSEGIEDKSEFVKVPSPSEGYHEALTCSNIPGSPTRGLEVRDDENLQDLHYRGRPHRFAASSAVECAQYLL